MSNITEEDYRKAILNQFAIAKNDDALSVGNYLTPAQLRNFCLMQYDSGLSKKDETIFRAFFDANGEDQLRRAIDNFGLGKLKSVISLLEGRDFQSRTRLELAAILVNFEPRPFQNFAKKGHETAGQKKKEVILIQRSEEVARHNSDKFATDKFAIADLEKHDLSKTRWIIKVAAAIIIFGVLGLTIFLVTKKECIQWQNDHYEIMDCGSSNSHTKFKNEVIAIDNRKSLRKIEVTAHTKTAALWYSKKNDTVEFFNESGMHPERGDALKPCTPYMRLKYHVRCKDNKYVSEKLGF